MYSTGITDVKKNKTLPHPANLTSDQSKSTTCSSDR